MKPKFEFSRAELNGLIAYVRQFGKDAIPKLPLSVRWSPRDGVLTATCTGGGYAVEVLLERVFAEEWEGVCSCKEELGCKHCLATAAFALGLEPGRPATEAVGGLAAKTKPTSNPRDDIANLVKAALGREPTPGEREYIEAVRSARQKYTLSHTFNLQDMITLAWDPAKPEVRPLPHLLSRANVGRWFPTQPESLLDFYHGVVRTLGFLGLRPAGFMAEVLKSNPPPPEWLKAWERDATSRWQSSLESAVGAGAGSVIPDHAAAADSRKLGLRLRLMAGSPAAESRLAESEPWRIPKKTELKELLLEVQALRLAAEAECAPLVFSVIRILSDPMRPELSYARGYSYVEGDSKVAVLLGKAQTRASIVCDDGTPVEAALRPATWKLVPSEFAADGAPSHFDLEPRLDDGSPVPIPIAIAEGNPIWFITASSVHRIPQLPDSLPHLQHIPAEVLQDATAIEALHHLGVDLPEQLTARIRRVPLKPVLSLNLQDAGKGRVSSPGPSPMTSTAASSNSSTTSTGSGSSRRVVLPRTASSQAPSSSRCAPMQRFSKGPSRACRPSGTRTRGSLRFGSPSVSRTSSMRGSSPSRPRSRSSCRRSWRTSPRPPWRPSSSSRSRRRRSIGSTCPPPSRRGTRT